MEPRRVCLCCGGASFSAAPWLPYDADGAPRRAHRVVACQQCGTAVVSPPPERSVLSALYASGIYRRRGGRATRIVGKVLDQLQRGRLREIAACVPGPGQLLDIGCGKGRFLRVAKSRGWEVHGQDTAGGQVDAALDEVSASVWRGELEAAGFEEGRFRVVTAWHVLEHVERPEELLREARRIVEAGGLLALEVPNFGSWQAALGRGKWFQLDVPRHLWQFTEAGLTRLLTENGFEVRKKSTWSIELGPFGMLQTLLNRLGCPPQGLFLFLKRAPTGPGTSGVVLCLALGGLLAGAASLLEGVAALMGKGGVIRVVAVRR